MTAARTWDPEKGYDRQAVENARRRAYMMKQKDIDRRVILRQLNREIRVPARYVSTAYDTIKKMPPHARLG